MFAGSGVGVISISVGGGHMEMLFCQNSYCSNSSEPNRLAFSERHPKNPKLGGVFFSPIMISRRWYGLFSIKSRLMI